MVQGTSIRLQASNIGHLTEREKDRLTNSVSSFIDEAVTVKDVKKTGAKIFKKIQKLVSYSYLHNIDEIGSS